METTVSNVLKDLSRETDKNEAEVISLAFQKGLKQMWREHLLGRYLRKEINRDEAIEAVGIDWVELAERQLNAAMEDVVWAIKK